MALFARRVVVGAQDAVDHRLDSSLTPLCRKQLAGNAL